MPKEIWVGPDEAFTSIASAARASEPGDILYIRAGTYTNDFVDIQHDLRIVGVGGKAHLKATVEPPNRKAYLITNGDITIENLEFSGVRVRDKNGAGIRHEGGDLTIKNSYFHHNEMSILTKAVMPDARVVIQGSEFAHTGNGTDLGHGIYISHIKSLEVEDSTFHHTLRGHHVKSRAAETTVKDSKFYDGDQGSASYAIDIPNGGKALIQGNEFQKGPRAENPSFIAFGEEGTKGGNSLTVEDNTFTTNNPWTTAVFNATGAVAELNDNSYSGVKTVASGPFIEGSTKPATSEDPPEAKPSPAEPENPPAAENEIHGTGSGDRLPGTPDDDRMHGHEGVDVLNGGAGNDTMAGGAGFDVLTGGDGADRFVYRSLQDSAANRLGWDHITDMSPDQGDRIVLVDIDANSKVPGNQPFTFIGTQWFTGNPGELNYRDTVLGSTVQGDIDGNRIPDFRIDLMGVGETTGNNFIL